jgi:hypothetical protein
MSEPISELFVEEVEAFAQRRDELLRLCEGKFALFKGKEFFGTFDTDAAAYNAGIEQFGNTRFLIQPVRRVPSVARFPALELGLLHAHP